MGATPEIVAFLLNKKATVFRIQIHRKSRSEVFKNLLLEKFTVKKNSVLENATHKKDVHPLGKASSPPQSFTRRDSSYFPLSWRTIWVFLGPDTIRIRKYGKIL